MKVLRGLTISPPGRLGAPERLAISLAYDFDVRCSDPITENRNVFWAEEGRRDEAFSVFWAGHVEWMPVAKRRADRSAAKAFRGAALPGGKSRTFGYPR